MTRQRWIHSALLAAAVVTSFAAPAAAELKVKLKTYEPPVWQEDPASQKKVAPIVRATVIGAPIGLTAEKFQLKELDTEPPVNVKAEKALKYTESDEPLALVILVQGDERWIGNETYIENEDDKMEGAFVGVGPAIDALAKAGPAGSQGALIIFREGKPEVKQAMGELSKLSGASLGAQQDYSGIGVPLVPALNEAWTMLGNMAGFRKALIVIGDGTGQKDDISTELRDIGKKLEETEVEIYTIHYSPVAQDSPIGQQNMTRLGIDGHKAASSRENFASFAQSFVELIGARYYVYFPGFDAKTKIGFTHDGAEHEYTLKVGEEESDPIALTTMLWNAPAAPAEGSLWWLWLILVLVLVIIVVVIIKKRGQQPQPMPMMAPMEEAPPPPAPSGPAKTIMLGIGGQDSGFPIVGWVVPLSGSNQYQTFKLRQGATLLGTGGAAHVVVGDGFMSTEHAEIICSPVGFILKDKGSTNGTFVNQRRIESHELVDNDVFTLGKTDFKFKSIN